MDRAAQLIAALYRNMDRPPVFNALTLFYFAAASFTETRGDSANPTWREGRFLGDHPRFAPAFEPCVDLAFNAPILPLVKQVLTAIEPIDIAGLSDLSRRNSYGVFASDCARGAQTECVVEEIDAMLARCGFVANPEPVP